MPYEFVKQTVAVIGATGQVGTPLTKTLLELGHDVKVLSRKPLSEEKAKDFGGAEVVTVPDMLNVEAMTKILTGVDALVCAVPGSEKVIVESN
ncbi:MAG: hypothetical protein SGARI_006746 [Bacillariaceae sp.]